MTCIYDVDSILKTDNINLYQTLAHNTTKLQIVSQGYNIAILNQQKELLE